MTHEELKAVVVEWYEAGKEINFGSMAGVDAWMDANYRLKEYARTLCEGRGEPEEIVTGADADKLLKQHIRREYRPKKRR